MRLIGIQVATLIAVVLIPGLTGVGHTGHQESNIPGEGIQKVISLDGSWDIAEGQWDTLPSAFPGKVPVPGLVKLAEPEFSGVGLPVPERDCFYYRKVFSLVREDPAHAILKINLVKYGAKIYLNGHKVAENWINFSPTTVNLTPYLKPAGEENELVIAVGAHIESLQDVVATGGEVEKIRYIPGIYDSVQLHLFEDIYFDSVQVAPVFEEGQITLQMTVRHVGSRTTYPARLLLIDDAEGSVVMNHGLDPVTFESQQELVTYEQIPAKGLKEWTPEHPHLYKAVIKLGPYRHVERFGWRGFRLDPAHTNRALLNGNPYFFRGTNIALFRFFEDPVCRDQPWNETWVRGLFRTFKTLGMNSARTCISVFPEFWYDIADEEGFALFAEYPIWYALKEGVSQADFDKERQDPQRKYGIYPEGLTREKLSTEYARWMQHLMNHPSIVAWDAQNETWSKETGAAIEMVRGLDYSNRPWDNGWSPPQRSTDIREAHQYFGRFRAGSEAENARGVEAARPFRLSDLKDKDKVPGTLYSPFQYAYKLERNDYRDQPCILNEYGYFWLNRDGSPTTLTKPYYDAVLGENASAEERRQHYAYILQGLTEFWRSARTCFGVLHVFGLAHSLPPDGATCDNFIDVNALKLDPHFAKAMKSAFAPVGLCIEQWEDHFSPGEMVQVPVTVTNDLGEPVERTVSVRIEQNGKVLLEQTETVRVNPWQQGLVIPRLVLPEKAGSYSLVARFLDEGQKHVFSRRSISIY